MAVIWFGMLLGKSEYKNIIIIIRLPWGMQCRCRPHPDLPGATNTGKRAPFPHGELFPWVPHGASHLAIGRKAFMSSVSQAHSRPGFHLVRKARVNPKSSLLFPPFMCPPTAELHSQHHSLYVHLVPFLGNVSPSHCFPPPGDSFPDFCPEGWPGAGRI